MYICFAVSLLGLFWTILFTKETGKKSLETLDNREVITKKTNTSEELERQRKML